MEVSMKTMTKKVWILVMCLVFLLTGCGMPDAVADEVKEVSRQAGFADGEESVQRFVKAYEAGEECMEKVKQSEIMAGRLDALAAFLEKKLADGTACIGDYNADTEELDAEEWDGEDPEEEHGLSQMDNNSYLMKNLKNWRNDVSGSKVFSGTSSVLEANFYIEQSKMPGFLQGLEEIGFQGISLPQEEYQINSYMVSQRVGFSIAFVPGYYYVTLSVSSDNFAYPEKYADLLENHMQNAFSTEKIMCGGDLDYISFQGSTDQPGYNYSKGVELYFKEGKVLQMNLEIWPYSSERGGEFFTEQEKRDLSRLFAWVTGDEKGAESFIEGLEESNEKEGTLGSYKWYRSKNKAEGRELIRIQ